MVLPLLLVDVAKKFLLNRYVLCAVVAVAVYVTGYYKGKASVVSHQAEQQIVEIQHAEVVRQQLEVEHDKRIHKILSAPVVDVDAERMLSNWPDQASDAQ